MFNYKFFSLFILLLMLSFVFLPIEVSASQPIRIIFNDRHFDTDVPPVSRNGIAFIPAKAVARAFGMDIRFFPKYNSLSLWNNNIAITVFPRHDTVFLSNIADGSNKEIRLTAPVFIYRGRTMIPLRFVAEIFDLSVSWLSASRTIIMSSPRPALPSRGTAYLPPAQPNLERRRMTSEEVTTLVEPATVQIQLHMHKDILRGSGFIIASNGLVLTNAHVVRGVENLYIKLKTGERFPAQIIKINNRSDLALLRIVDDTGRTFPYIRHRAYQSSVFTGDTVISFGNPGSHRWFVSEGVVTRISGLNLAPAWAKDYPLIIHNAYTDTGSSGGVLVNLYGEWIGVNALTAVNEELGYAVPADFFYELLEGNYFGLNCDWESLWTESFMWTREVKRSKDAFDKGLNASNGSQEQANAWRESLAIIENIRFFPSMYVSLFPELFHLPRLFVSAIDARIVYYSYHINTLEGRAVWKQDERDRLWNNIELAVNEYNKEFHRVSLLVGNQSAYKAELP